MLDELEASLVTNSVGVAESEIETNASVVSMLDAPFRSLATLVIVVSFVYNDSENDAAFSLTDHVPLPIAITCYQVRSNRLLLLSLSLSE